jgi:hypothetical protein
MLLLLQLQLVTIAKAYERPSSPPSLQTHAFPMSWFVVLGAFGELNSVPARLSLSLHASTQHTQFPMGPGHPQIRNSPKDINDPRAPSAHHIKHAAFTAQDRRLHSFGGATVIPLIKPAAPATTRRCRSCCGMSTHEGGLLGRLATAAVAAALCSSPLSKHTQSPSRLLATHVAMPRLVAPPT